NSSRGNAGANATRGSIPTSSGLPVPFLDACRRRFRGPSPAGVGANEGFRLGEMTEERTHRFFRRRLVALAHRFEDADMLAEPGNALLEGATRHGEIPEPQRAIVQHDDNARQRLIVGGLREALVELLVEQDEGAEVALAQAILPAGQGIF